jgi:ribonuclease R
MARKAKSKHPARTRKASVPSRDELLAFISDNPGNVGKREIARAFGITGSDRIPLKQMLKELADEGLIAGRSGRLHDAGSLPPVGVLSIVDRTSDGDLVAAPADWDESAGPPPRIIMLPTRGRPPAPTVGDRVLARLAAEGGGYTAGIIRVLERQPETLLGVVKRVGRDFRLEPVDRKQREALIPIGARGAASEGDLVSVRIGRARRGQLPEARVVDVVGSMKDEKAVSMIAILAHAIPFEFPDPALAEAKGAQPVRPSKDREDWRHLPLITIDPADAKDHDDAVHAAPDDDPKNKGGFVVTVAIADVGWFVRPGTALDREARKRGNSVYFPDRVVPMLPERLSGDLCSLRVGKDRPALAARLVFAADGRKRGHSFHRVLIRSVANLTYTDTQAAFDASADPPGEDVGTPILKPLWQAYQAVARARAERQPLDLEIPERKVIIGKDGKIERIVTRQTLEAHRLIEEFMIQANVAAAETLEQAKSPLVYRIHDTPSLAKLEALREFLESIEVSFPRSGNLRPSHFNGILSRLRATEHGQLIHEVVLRTQSQAEYSPANIGHFGLNLMRYAHFTSPIRRYADLIVHRGLIRSLGLGAGGLPDGIEKELPEIAAEISAAERRAMAAERDTIDRLVAHWLADRVGAEFHGRIAGVTRAGLFVKLDETGADGFVPMSTIGREYFVYDEARHTIFGRDTGRSYRLGDAADVRLLEVAPLAGALRFEMLSEGRETERRARKTIGRSGRGKAAGKPKARPKTKGKAGPKQKRRRG